MYRYRRDLRTPLLRVVMVRPSHATERPSPFLLERRHFLAGDRLHTNAVCVADTLPG